MTPAEIVAALVRHGTRIAVEGERVRLVFNGNAPPDDLVRAAREAKAALREIVAAVSPKRTGAPYIAPLPEHVAKGLSRLQASSPLWNVCLRPVDHHRRHGSPHSPAMGRQSPVPGLAVRAATLSSTSTLKTSPRQSYRAPGATGCNP
jgi:hypothetical protein